MAYNFIYFNNENTHEKADIKIATKQRGNYTKIRIWFSIKNTDDISKTGYVRFAVPEEDENKLFFMTVDKTKGYKLHKATRGGHYLEIQQKNIVELITRFEGNYKLEITDENFIYVDRRNAL